ncbi:MAG: AAA family ATPase [Burkholderiaceae bacterium]|nr:AAA family ATPase [Burkholderiaceae bacterium]
MIRCIRCAHDNPVAQKFCGECGTPLQGPLAAGASAQSLAAVYTPPHLAKGALSYRFALEGERKRVTVMFCDIADSTPLASRVGAEGMHGLLNLFFERSLAEVHRYEGTVNQFLGDGFMALFGAPIAHEDHARRALLAAHAIQQQMRDAASQGQPLGELQLRMGLNTGTVVVGKIGDNLRMDYTAIGDTTNLAARLQGHAQPGTIRVSDSTRRAAAAHFEFDDLGRHALKGIDEPVPVFAPMAARPAGKSDSQMRSGGIASALVGREPELAALSRSLDGLRQGHGGVVLLRGEPGAGKSRLLAEARRQPAAQSVLWLEGRCVSFGRGLSYWPFIEILRGAFQIDEGDAETEALRKLEAGVRTLFDARAAEIVPYVATVMSLALGGEHEQRVKFLDAQAMKRQVFLSMRLLFERLAQRQPTLLVLEDWHWVDQSSIALCEHLLPLAESRPLSLWLSTRAEPAEPAARTRAAALALRGVRFEEIALALLAPEHSGALIHNLVGAGGLPESVREQIQRRTEGNPFFIEEVIRAFIADGTLVEDKRASGWRLARPPAGVTIPDTVQGVIVARIDRLDESVKNVLKLASVIGRSFFLRVLQAIADAADAVEPGLGRLEETELIQLRQRAPEIEYMFKHALVQEAAYDSMLAERRRAIHRSVAQAIERLFPERCGDEFASLLAYHYACAQDWPKAQTFLLAAGDQAGRVAADAEALEHYRQAEATFMKVAARELTPLQRATMDRKLGQAFHGVGNHDEAVAHYTRALAHLGIRYPQTRGGVRREIARYMAGHFLRRGLPRFMRPALDAHVAQEASTICEARMWLDFFFDEERLALDSLVGLDVGERSGDARIESRGLAALGLVLLTFGANRLAKRSLLESIAMATRAHAPAERALALYTRGWFEWATGSLDDGMRSLEQSASACRAFGDLRSWAGATAQLIWVLAHRSEYARATSLAAELVRVGQGTNDPHLESWGLVCLANLERMVGPLDQALQRIEHARRLCQRLSAWRMHANAGGVMAKCLLKQGRIAQAREVLHESMRVLEARGMKDLFYIESIAALTELCLLEAERSDGGARKAALRAARSACAKALKCADRAAAAWRPETLRLHGTLAWLDHAEAAAIRRWRQSIETAEQMKLPLDRARGLLEMGERTGDASLVEQACGVFEAIGAHVDRAFGLHESARLASVGGAHTDEALRRYDAAIDALEAVKADHASGLARRERDELARGRSADSRGSQTPDVASSSADSSGRTP